MLGQHGGGPTQRTDVGSERAHLMDVLAEARVLDDEVDPLADRIAADRTGAGVLGLEAVVGHGGVVEAASALGVEVT